MKAKYDETFTLVAEGQVHVGRGEIIVTGTPPEDDDPETGHNCDDMGCGQWHVLYRAPLAASAPKAHETTRQREYREDCQYHDGVFDRAVYDALAEVP